jgi:hypothetical protein
MKARIGKLLVMVAMAALLFGAWSGVADAQGR